MIAPRISLWTPAITFPFRLARQSFDEFHLTDQTAQIQSSQQDISITPGAMYILSNIIGRRTTESVRWVLLDSLHEIVRGDLQTRHPESQDLLASTFGEIFGVLVVAFDLGGQVEIVRLLETNLGKMPDFLILQSDGQREVQHLLECKGSVEDVNNVNKRAYIDICRHIRSFRSAGEQQLDEMVVSAIRPGTHIAVTTTRPFGLASRAANHYLSVVCIPDGRIPRLIDSRVQQPQRQACAAVDCVSCISPNGNARESHILGVLHKKPVSDRAMSAGLRRFVNDYRRMTRVLWADDDDGASSTFQHIAGEAQASGRYDVDQDTIAYMTAAALTEADERNLDLSFETLRQVSALATPDTESIVGQVPQNYERQSNSPRQPITHLEFPQYLTSLRTRRPDPNRPKLLIENFSVSRSTIRAAIENDGPTSVIRLTASESSADAYTALRQAAEQIIQQTRPGPVIQPQWRPESARRGDVELNLGQSWDEYPSPDQLTGRPGITAWISREGRGEVIIRYPD